MDAAVGICGIGEVYSDERPGDNWNNSSVPMYARVDTACWQHAATHELLHTLGSVQMHAPNSTPEGHCTDENDVMCYVDAPGVSMSLVCAGALPAQVDCNHNDYFNPAPAAGTYLASHWNTANSRFLQPDVSPPPPVQAQLSVPAKGYPGEPWPVSSTLRIPDSRTVRVAWSVTRSGCRFANPRARRTTLSCPVTTAGEGQVALTVRDSIGQTARFVRTVSFVRPRSPRATLLRLRPSSGLVLAGRSVTLKGVLADPADGARIYGMPVTVYGLRAGSSRWEVVARTRTDVAGRIRVTLRPRRNTTYLAHSSATSSWNWDASPRRAVQVAAR
jgi:hypothetical protein